MESPEIGAINGQGDVPTARLRILETTDLHMQILGYDYFSDQVADSTGLIHLADTIDALRSQEGVTALLFDNGDFIQGNPLADYIASMGPSGQTHPMIAAMNTLQYDAVTLGNHEFNYGLAFLQDSLADATFPITCANITHLKGAALAQPFLILERELPCTDGTNRTLRIGVTGFVTPQITDWDKAALEDSIKTDDIVAAATMIVPAMKAAGADIIVALCHSGIGAIEHSQRMENAAVPLAAISGIDIVLTGHTHEVFPGDSVMRSDAIDPETGTLHGKPAVMAGFYGNWLGVVDLELGWKADQWQITRHHTKLQTSAPKKGPSALQTLLSAHVQDAHTATLDHIRQPIAQTNVAIHSYFAGVTPDLSQQLLATAQIDHIAEALAQTQHHALPVLSATSPFRAGGRAGASHYIHVPPGPFALRDAAAIYPFANTLCAMRCSGAQLRDWLERAASLYARIMPGAHDQPLLDAHMPAYNSDTIFGLHYRFDLSQPARYGAEGAEVNPDAQRLCTLQFQGQPVRDDAQFAVAVNSYRANGGGGFACVPAADIVYTSTQTTRDILVSYLRETGIIDGKIEDTWGFKHHPDTSAIFHSAPTAREYLSKGLAHIGPGSDGFERYKITF